MASINTLESMYVIDSVYDFKVKNIYPNYCEIIDPANGITTYLQGTAKLKLFKEQVVKCRVKSFTGKHPIIELVDISEFEPNDSCLTEEKLSNLLNQRELVWSAKDFVKLLLMDETDISFEQQCNKWIQVLLNKKVDLGAARRNCTDLLELSELLDLCSESEREVYQNRLTFLIEQLGFCIRAAELIKNDSIGDNTDTSDTFINNLFEKLRVSGFVYHPNKNFNILSSLFLLKPELMNQRMAELFDIICNRDLTNWKKEPFRSSMVKLLEHYISACDGMVDKTKDNQSLINNLLTALALQLLLIGENGINEIADYRLTSARICLASSYYKDIKPSSKLLDLALQYLLGENVRIARYSLSEVKKMLLPFYLSNTNITEGVNTVNTYTHNKTKLLVSNNGIQLMPSGANDKSHPALPKDLELWQNLQVYLSSKPTVGLASIKPNDINSYQRMWEGIEFDIFNQDPRNVKVSKVKKKRIRNVGDTVEITFARQDPDNKNKYYCHIEDEDGGEGYILICDIVPYTLNTTSLRHFFANDGSRFVFEAKIIQVEGETYHLQMLHLISDWIAEDEGYSYDETIICSLGANPNGKNSIPAVTSDGVGVSIKNAGDFDGLSKGSIVGCRLLGHGHGTFAYEMEIEEISQSEFDLNSAFKNLMEAFAIGRIPEALPKQEEEQILETDKVLDESYIKEIIYLIDRKSQLETDQFKSYNYLGFARVLSMMIGWESQAAFYKGRMGIISMLHYFAINSKIDDDQLKQLESANAELFSSNVIMKERFGQLQTVSYLGKTEYNEELFKISCENQALKPLALLVLAYNITRSSGMDSTSDDIRNRINQQLNVKGYEIGLKLYGTGVETIDTEYKMSLVYHAGEEADPYNPEKQKEEILHVINSFLNTSGGTLYFGVNDYGYGEGIENDLKTPLFYGDKDKYTRYIIDAITLKWGNAVATTYIESIEYDQENTDKDILIVKIKPHKTGIPMDGVWWVRVGSTKRRLNEKEYADFVKENRKVQDPQISRVETPTEAENDAVTTKAPKKEPASNLSARKDNAIPTSKIRKNVLVDYMDFDNYVEPIAFLKFLDDYKFKKLVEYDYDEETTLLTLTVTEEESDGYLVLGYENGLVVKAPLSEILEYQSREYSRSSEGKLIFASIAHKDDALLTISIEAKAKAKPVMRLDSIMKIGEGRISNAGSSIINEGLISKVMAYDIVPHSKLTDFSVILDKPRTTAGLPQNSSTKLVCNMLHLWGISEI